MEYLAKASIPVAMCGVIAYALYLTKDSSVLLGLFIVSWVTTHLYSKEQVIVETVAEEEEEA